MITASLSQAQCRVRPSGCMSGCRSGGSVAIRSPGRMAYMFGPVEAEDMDDLQRFLELYHSEPAGVIQDARALDRLRFKALARIPSA